MMNDVTDRTITFRVRTTAYGVRTLTQALATWLQLGEDKYRRIDMYEQRVDGVDMYEQRVDGADMYEQRVDGADMKDEDEALS